jgi:uncharacterized protein
VAWRWNVGGAVAINTVLFSLLHWTSGQPWIVVAGTVLFALFTSFWALAEGSIWGVMGWHAAWNGLIAVGFELPITGIETNLPALLVRLTPRAGEILTGGEQGPEGSVLCTLFFALASAVLLVLYLRQRRRAPCAETSGGSAP